MMNNPTKGSDSGVHGSLAAVTALALLGVAAVALTGDSLLRAVRNSPFIIAFLVTGALVAGSVFAIAQFWPKADAKSEETGEATETAAGDGEPETTRVEGGYPHGHDRARVSAVALLALVAMVSAAIFAGAGAVVGRESPVVTLQSAPVSPAASGQESKASNTDTIEITVTAHAVGMITTDQLLVQVLGLRDFSPSTASTVDVCEQNHMYTGDSRRYSPLSGDSAVLLLWNRMGPRSDGSFDATWKVQVPAGQYAGVCAWSPLPTALNSKTKGGAVYLKLDTS